MSVEMLTQIGMAAINAAGRRKPDLVIGDPAAPYMLRWHLRESGPSGGLYLHHIQRDDDDRALHDHPWDFSVFVIDGIYREIRSDAPNGEVFFPLSYRCIKAETAHRIEVIRPAWTLCFTGPRRREWGFHCPNGWVPWRDFVAPHNSGEIGRGCGEETP
jgi:hypothetical protein